jgi:N utilization substance protein B
MSARRENRVAAMQFLYQWSINVTDDLAGALYLFFKDMPHERDYYAFAEELIHGAIACMGEVDAVIRQYLQNWDFVRLAIYEMLKRRDIPPIVSINEAIDLSKEFSNPDAKRFINGILDQFKVTLDRPFRSAAMD